MFVLPAAARHARAVSLCAVVLLFTLIGANGAWGQQTPRSRPSARDSGEFPRLPGAVSKPPASLGKDAPFDVAKFFAAPPRDRNAAPLYLDALFEFSPAVIEVWNTAQRRAVPTARRGGTSSHSSDVIHRGDLLHGFVRHGFRRLQRAE